MDLLCNDFVFLVLLSFVSVVQKFVILKGRIDTNVLVRIPWDD